MLQPVNSFLLRFNSSLVPVVEHIPRPRLRPVLTGAALGLALNCSQRFMEGERVTCSRPRYLIWLAMCNDRAQFGLPVTIDYT